LNDLTAWLAVARPKTWVFCFVLKSLVSFPIQAWGTGVVPMSPPGMTEHV
jgi:hypothetical protein